MVYERLGRSATPLFNEKELCGLARGLATRGRLDPEAIASALAAIRRFRALAGRSRCASLHVLATAVREASNGPEFIAAVEAITEVPVALLTGAEAAVRTRRPSRASTSPNGIAGDLGGGSLEDRHRNETGSGRARRFRWAASGSEEAPGR